MIEWWLAVINALDELDVVYCLSGESNLWIGEESRLLPDKSTDDLMRTRLAQHVGTWIRRRLPLGHWLRARLLRTRSERRRRQWSLVLDRLSRATRRPFLIHPIPQETGFEAVHNPQRLAANTVQTGHSSTSRRRLWEEPLRILRADTTGKGYINLEPWYEGIHGTFAREDQLFAYWASMLAGALSYCYGAQGIWNVGDGSFLAHWGRTTIEEAMQLDTPRLIGLSHQQFLNWKRGRSLTTFFEVNGNDLVLLGAQAGERTARFFPQVAAVEGFPDGRCWLPLKGVFTEAAPSRGQLVVFSED
jgi:hypothetical protein